MPSVGSSSTNSLGWPINAAASPVRWRMPLEKPPVLRRQAAGSSPTSSSTRRVSSTICGRVSCLARPTDAKKRSAENDSGICNRSGR